MEVVNFIYRYISGLTATAMLFFLFASCGSNGDDTKQNVTINEVADTLVRFTPENDFCLFGSYDVSPESPNGQKVLYVKFKTHPVDNSSDYECDVFMADVDGKNHKKIIGAKGISVHNGAETVWINNHLFAVNGIDKNGKNGVAIVDTTGQVVFGPYDGLSGQHKMSGKHIPVYKRDAVYTLNWENGVLNEVATINDIAAWKEEVGGHDDPKKWALNHPTLSPDGNRLAFVLNSDGKAINEYLFHCKLTGEDMVFFGRKPGHWEWYDNHSIYGNDSRKDESDWMIKRWDLKGKWLEDLAGKATHLAMSPVRQYFAADGAIDGDRFVHLYQKYETEPTLVIDRHKKGFVDSNDGLRAHINPSFSRDGKRVYFNRTYIENNDVEGWYADISYLYNDK